MLESKTAVDNSSWNLTGPWLVLQLPRSQDAGVFGRPLPIGMAMMKDTCLDELGETPGALGGTDRDRSGRGGGGFQWRLCLSGNVTITDIFFNP